MIEHAIATLNLSSETNDSMLPLTFGLELELVFAFRQQKITPFLPRDAHLVRTLGPTERQALRNRLYKCVPYNSWAVGNAGSNSSTIEPLVTLKDSRVDEKMSATDGDDDDDDNPHATIMVRAYIDEPLRLLHAELATIPGRTGIQLHSATDEDGVIVKQTEFPDWTVSGDATISGLAKEDLLAAFPDRINGIMVAGRWDSYGVELISPPYANVRRCIDDLVPMLKQVGGPASYVTDMGLAASARCGLHVHIGLPTGEPLPIKTLQHLAYMLIVYEDEISALQDVKRHVLDLGRGTKSELTTNRENFMVECPEPVKRCVIKPASAATAEDDNITEQQEEERLMVPVYEPLSTVRARIFDDVDASADPLSALVKLMGRRKSHMVNWSYLLKPSGEARTLEFRQGSATTDPARIELWLEFCTRLVRLAHRYATATATTNGTKFCVVADWDQPIRIETLLEELGFGDEERATFQERYREFRSHPSAPPKAAYWVDFEEFDDNFLV